MAEKYIHIIGPAANLSQPTPSIAWTARRGCRRHPTFSWSQVPGNAGYQIIVSTNPADLTTDPGQPGGTPANGFNVTVPANQTSYNWTAALSAGPMYYWAVHALGNVASQVNGLWSNLCSFVTAAATPTVTITSPSAGSTYYIGDGSATAASRYADDYRHGEPGWHQPEPRDDAVHLDRRGFLRSNRRRATGA